MLNQARKHKSIFSFLICSEEKDNAIPADMYISHRKAQNILMAPVKGTSAVFNFKKHSGVSL